MCTLQVGTGPLGLLLMGWLASWNDRCGGLALTAVEQMLHFDQRKEVRPRHRKDKRNEESVVGWGEATFSCVFLSALSVIHLDFTQAGPFLG